MKPIHIGQTSNIIILVNSCPHLLFHFLTRGPVRGRRGRGSYFIRKERPSAVQTDASPLATHTRVSFIALVVCTTDQFAHTKALSYSSFVKISLIRFWKLNGMRNIKCTCLNSVVYKWAEFELDTWKVSVPRLPINGSSVVGLF